MKRMNLILRLHVNQQKVFNCTKRFIVLVAGRRFGKTVLALLKLIICSLTYRNAYYWYLSPTYKQSKTIAWRLIKNLIPPEIPVKYNESELSVEFPNGSRLELKGADNKENLLGVGLWGCVIDEFASIRDRWVVWHEIVRPMLTDRLGWVIFIGTPKGKNEFWKLYNKGRKYHEKNWQSFRFTSYDNPLLPDGELEEAKKDSPERYFRQEFLASFEDFTGLVYPEFDEKTHIVEPYHLLDSYKRIGSIDPAISGVTCALKAVIDEEGCLIIYDEYYETNVRVSEVSKEIKQKGVRWYIDPASAAKNIQREGEVYSLYDEYCDNGIRPEKAQNEVEAGINRVAEYLMQGKIKVFSTCTNTIEEFQKYHFAERKETVTGEIQVKPYKKDDHAMDNVRYLVASRFSKTDLEVPVDISPNSPLAKMLEAKKRRTQSRW